jgi:hypothetical protein
MPLLLIPLTLYPQRYSKADILRHSGYSFETHMIYQKDLAMRNTADVAGNSTVVWSQSISDVSAEGSLVASTTSLEERERGYSIRLSRTPPETLYVITLNISD